MEGQNRWMKGVQKEIHDGQLVLVGKRHHHLLLNQKSQNQKNNYLLVTVIKFSHKIHFTS